MMFEEFVDFRVGSGDAVRDEREREQARQVQEHRRWLRSAARRVRRGGATAVRPAVAPTSAGAEAADVPDGTEGAEAPTRELAHAAR